MGHGNFSADRSDVDDAPFAAPAKVRERFHDELEGRPEVEIHGALEIFALHVLGGANFDDAGIIDNHVNAAKMIDDLLDRAGDLGGIEQIAGDRDRFTAAANQFVARSRELIGIACEPMRRGRLPGRIAAPELIPAHAIRP